MRPPSAILSALELDRHGVVALLLEQGPQQVEHAHASAAPAPRAGHGVAARQFGMAP